MNLPEEVHSLPAIIALDAYAILRNQRRGTSIQLDETYFDGQLSVLQALETTPQLEKRIQVIQRSAALYDDIHIDFPSLTRQNLWDASRRFRGILQQLPEVAHLQRVFPETCLIVPHWLRSDGQVTYGARIYFFRNDDAPDPEEIVRENIESVMTDDPERFERYHGRLHGYPDCCIDHYHDRSPDSPPELRAIQSFADHTIEALGPGPDTEVSVADIIPNLLEDERGYAFFAREFFPEPQCDAARSKGRRVFDALDEVFPTTLVRDYFRLNFGFNYLVAQSVVENRGNRPAPGTLGKEHLYFYLPLDGLLSISRYQ